MDDKFYKDCVTYPEKKKVYSQRIHVRRPLRIGDVVIYDPFRPHDIGESWRKRIGTEGVVVELPSSRHKIGVRFVDKPNATMRPRETNLYLVGTRIDWEL